MALEEIVRIDKWLWAVRIYKTRSQASEECRKGRIIINGNLVKPSYIVKRDEIIVVRKPPAIYTFQVLDILGKRVSAEVAKNYVNDLTSDEELARHEISRINLNFQRDAGSGRPTKKDRREIVKVKGK